MKVFLTGATGYIGTALVKNLTAAGHSILGMARSAESETKLREQGIEVHRGELSDPASMAEGAKKADAVIHTAFPQMGPETDFEEQMKIMTAAVAAMVDSLKGTDKTFILTSGAGGYGPQSGRTPIDETTPVITPTHAPREKIVLGATLEGLRSIVVRPTIVYGHGGSGPLMGWFRISRERGGGVYIGEGDALISTVYLDDLADLYRLALEKAEPGEAYNAASGTAITTKMIAEAISKATGLAGKTISIPSEEIEKLGFIGRLIGSNMVVSAEKAVRELGWQPSGPSLLDELTSGSYAS